MKNKSCVLVSSDMGSLQLRCKGRNDLKIETLFLQTDDSDCDGLSRPVLACIRNKMFQFSSPRAPDTKGNKRIEEDKVLGILAPTWEEWMIERGLFYRKSIP